MDSAARLAAAPTHEPANAGWRIVVETEPGLPMLIRVLERLVIAELRPTEVSMSEREGAAVIELRLQSEAEKIAIVSARLGSIPFVTAVRLDGCGAHQA